jgi:hypothetical protein
MNPSEETNTIAIYRFKFTEEFMSELYQFSKIHQYDDRLQFKEAWELWVENNNEIINMETRRLLTLRYEGDILEKMFKSARYYFRKKSTEKKEPIERRKYVGLSKNLLDAMDEHIRIHIKNQDYQPKTGFVHFCNGNIPLLKDVIQELNEKDPKVIEAKFKKTYKNRYFVIANK